MLHTIWQNLDKIMSASSTHILPKFPQCRRENGGQTVHELHAICENPSSSPVRCAKSEELRARASSGPRGPGAVLRLLEQPVLCGGEQLAGHHREPAIPHHDV